MTSHGTEPASCFVGERTGLLEEVCGSRIARYASENDTPEQRRTTEAVGSVNATSDLTGSEKTRNGHATSTKDARLGVDLEATHGVVKNGGHEGNVEDVVHPPFTGLEELFSEWALLSPYDVVVILE